MEHKCAQALSCRSVMGKIVVRGPHAANVRLIRPKPSNMQNKINKKTHFLNRPQSTTHHISFGPVLWVVPC